MEGLIGLKNNINRKEDRVQELNSLENLSNKIQQDRDDNIKAQQAEQAFYENIYAQSKTMLEKDRIKINSKVSRFQRQIKNHLSNSGGDRKQFMENGGLSIMNNIKNEILNSEEAIMYDENQKNLSKILEIQAKKMGHLINPNDLKALDNYKNSENGGRISYSGLMNEVEIPPSANFDYGTDIPIDKIISYDANRMKIIANYQMVHPEKGMPNQAELKSFTKRMGYGGTGSNMAKLQAEAALRKERIRNRNSKNDKSSNSAKPEKERNAITDYKSWVAEMPVLNYKEMKAERDKTGKSFIEQYKSKNKSAGGSIGKKSTIQATQRNLDEKGFDYQTVNNVFNDDLALQESYEILPNHKFNLAAAAYGANEQNGSGLKMENGKLIDFEPTEDMFRMDGVQMSGDQSLEQGEYKGDYEVLGNVTAMQIMVDGKPELLVNSVDGDGNLASNQSDLDENYLGDNGGSEGQLITVSAIRDEDGNVFYKPFDMETSYGETYMANRLGSSINTTKTVERGSNYKRNNDFIKATTKQERIDFQRAVDETDDVFTNNYTLMEDEINEYASGMNDRSGMMKAYYLALDQQQLARNPQSAQIPKEERLNRLMDNKFFSVNALEGDIVNPLRDYSQGNSQENIIGAWLENINDDNELSDLEKEAHRDLAQKWNQILGFI